MKQMMPTTMPIGMAESGLTYPQAGVIATSPATAPETTPRTVGAPSFHHSMKAQASPAAAAAVFVVDERIGGDAVRGQGAPGIEAEPAEPEERAAQNRKRQVVGRECCLAVTNPFSDQEAQ